MHFYYGNVETIQLITEFHPELLPDQDQDHPEVNIIPYKEQDKTKK